MPAKELECFVIMPISEPEDYEKGHFQHVYEDIIAPACETAGYKPIRANDVLQTNLIHLDVLNRIVHCPMAICDLSTRNPNVLFELGLRQAFDKAVVLIQEKGTRKIFDIAPLRYTEYRKERIYHQVLEDQEKISQAIQATASAVEEGHDINSIINLLSLTSPAALKEFQKEDSSRMLQLVMAEMDTLRQELRHAVRSFGSRIEAHREDLAEDVRRLTRRFIDAEKSLEVGRGDPRALSHTRMLCHACLADAEKLMRRPLPPTVREELLVMQVRARGIMEACEDHAAKGQEREES